MIYERFRFRFEALWNRPHDETYLQFTQYLLCLDFRVIPKRSKGQAYDVAWYYLLWRYTVLITVTVCVHCKLHCSTPHISTSMSDSVSNIEPSNKQKEFELSYNFFCLQKMRSKWHWRNRSSYLSPSPELQTETTYPYSLQKLRRYIQSVQLSQSRWEQRLNHYEKVMRIVWFEALKRV